MPSPERCTELASLRDKLRATAPKAQKPVKPAPQDCYVKESRFPLSGFELSASISGSLLSLMMGKEYEDIRREDICFLDTETTGLSHGAGTVAFLVGIGFFEEDAFVVRQYLMRDYDEESFVLDRTAKDIERARILCTFNGATFDMPLLDVRFTMQRMREKLVFRPHLDLLPAARRVWKLRLKKCNLGCLESAVLGMERVDDLEGDFGQILRVNPSPHVLVN